MEVNFWVPLSRVYGTNSLWTESEPGKGDFRPVEAEPGVGFRFYGNQCEVCLLLLDPLPWLLLIASFRAALHMSQSNRAHAHQPRFPGGTW